MEFKELQKMLRPAAPTPPPKKGNADFKKAANRRKSSVSAIAKVADDAQAAARG
jgi:hypothetical protein